MPADHTNKRDVMQKKLMDCPISNQEPIAAHQVMDKGQAGISYRYRSHSKRMSSSFLLAELEMDGYGEFKIILTISKG